MEAMNDRDIYATGVRLWRDWTRMWNGTPELALELVAPQFVLHLPLPETASQETIVDPVSAERWVRAHRAKFDRLEFRYDCGPFVDVRAGVVAGPWIADVVIDGAPRPTCGMDTIAFRDGKITEYWTLGKPVEAFGRWSRGLMVGSLRLEG
jgi:hypothetical protein